VNFSALELSVAGRSEDPVAIMQMQHSSGRDDGVYFRLAAAEDGGDEHAELEDAWIGNFNTDLGGAQVGIEDGADVADVPGEDTVRIGADPNLRFLTELEFGQIIFEDVAKDPDMREVGDGEGSR